MSLLVLFLVALIVVLLLLYVVDLIPVGDSRIRLLIKAVIVLIAVLWFIQRTGLLADL